MCGMPSVLRAEPGAGLGSRDSGRLPQHPTSLPAPAPSASSSTWCAEKTVVCLLKSLRIHASLRRGLARGPHDGNVTQRRGAAPAHALREHVLGRLKEL